MNKASIIVAYKPNITSLNNLLKVVSNSTNCVILVNNGIDSDLYGIQFNSFANLRLITLNDNKGIATAQNIGITAAIESNADYVIFFDQDSDPTIDNVSFLFKCAKSISERYQFVACVGPSYFDLRRMIRVPFIRLQGLRLVSVQCSEYSSVIPVDHLISSGSVIAISVLKDLGGMRDDLFIDYVDLEWCERAISKGYQSFGICGAQINHMLGDQPINFMGTSYPARSPLRHYYMFRNAIWMYRQSYVRWNWKIVDGLRLFRKYVFYSLFARPRHVHFWMMTKGIFHGLIGRMGKYSG